MQNPQRSHQETNERVHGVVTNREAQDYGAVAGYAQRGDLQETRQALEAPQRQRQDPLHTRGGAPAAQAHGRLPRLQVPAEKKGEVELLQAEREGREDQREQLRHCRLQTGQEERQIHEQAAQNSPVRRQGSPLSVQIQACVGFQADS